MQNQLSLKVLKNVTLENGKENQQKIWNMTLILSNGWKAVPPYLPPREDGGHFMQRVCMEFETFVERMMRTGETSAVLMVHGGTIMSILSAYGLPRAPFYDWMVEPGHGYSLRITPGLWMRSMVAEVYDTIPPREQQQNREHTVIDYAREAANRAFGDKEETES